jgi:hypothetical protein
MILNTGLFYILVMENGKEETLQIQYPENLTLNGMYDGEIMFILSFKTNYFTYIYATVIRSVFNTKTSLFQFDNKCF